MASFNKITIVGYLGRDPELRWTPNGDPVCNLSVATTEKIKGNDHTTWFRLVVWGKSAEACNNFLHKGSQVYAEGRLRQEEYTDKEGNKRYNLEVNVSDVKFLGGKGEREEEGQTPQAAAAAVKAQAPSSQRRALDIDPDDIPF